MHNGVQDVTARLEEAVWRVEYENEPGEVKGTAFFIAPGLAVTCAHVLPATGAVILRRGQARLTVRAGAMERSPDFTSFDVAVMTVSEGTHPVLACIRADASGDKCVSRGYSRAAPEGRQSAFEPRGRFHARYSCGDIEYGIADAYELAGDMAEPGFSGSPLISLETGACVGLIVGGHGAVNRSWAVPFELDRKRFPALTSALEWNAAHQPVFGIALNDVGLELLWRHAASVALAGLAALGKYEAELSVKRSSVFRRLEEYLSSDFPAAVVVGPSGTGKTWLLADFAQRDGTRLLLPAAQLDRNTPPPLPALISARLAEAAKQLGVPAAMAPTTIERLLLKRATERAVLLDGLNEAHDVRHFLEHWVGEAFLWCRQHGVRLICTTRPEIWPGVVEAIGDPGNLLFSTNGPSADNDAASPSRDNMRDVDRCIRMEDFDDQEANAALSNYELPPDLKSMLRGHPLLFRLAQRLQLATPNADIGRYRLLDTYVDQKIALLFAKLGFQSPRPLRMRLKQLGGAVDRSKGGTLDWSEAVQLVGGDGVLDELLASGLLIATGDRVRVQFDELVEVLAPAPVVTSSLFLADEDAPGDIFEIHARALLRFESEGEEAEFATGMTCLEKAFQNAASGASPFDSIWRFWPFLQNAHIIARSLPARRAAETDAIYAWLSETANVTVRHYFFSDLVRWIEDAPLSLSRRAELLLKIAPWSNTWPFRLQDWTDSYRRHAFEASLGERNGAHVAGALHRLALAAFDHVSPILFSALDDERRVDRGQSAEDSCGDVAAMVAGILFFSRAGHLGTILDGVVTPWRRRSYQLIQTLAETNPDEVCAWVLSRLVGAERQDWLLTLLSAALNHAGPDARALARDTLKKLSTSSLALKLEILKTLRQIDPHDVATWDLVAEAFAGHQAGASLRPVPQGRFAKAVAVSDDWPPQALDWIRFHDGPVDEQKALADQVRAWLARRAITARETAELVEGIGYEFYKAGSEKLEPWLELALDIIATNDVDARRCLIYLLNWEPEAALPPALDPIERCLLASGLADEEIDLYVEKQFPLGDSVARSDWNRIDRLRAADPLRTDRIIWKRNYYSEGRLQRVLQLWRTTGLQSEISSGVVALDAATPSGEPFDLDRAHKIVLRATGDL